MEQPTQGAYADAQAYWDPRTGETFFGPRAPISIPRAADDTFREWRAGDTLERVAFDAYGTPELAWLVADINDVVDPFLIEIGARLRLPSRARVEIRTVG